MAQILLLLLLFVVPADIQQGLEALRDGRLEVAKSDFLAVTKEDPQSGIAWVSLAETYRRLGDFNNADSSAQKAEAAAPDAPAVQHALASFFSQRGQFAQAAKWEESYAASGQGDAQATERAAELYQRAGDEANAGRLLKLSWQRNPQEVEPAFRYARLLLHRLDFPGAAEVIKPALAAHPDDAQLVLTQGVIEYGERQFPTAIDQFLKVISLDPSIPQPYDFVGRMIEHAGEKLPQIRAAFEARIKAAPDDLTANLALAKADLASDPKDSTAERLLRHAIDLDASLWEPHYQLGVLLEAKHDFLAAAEQLKLASELDPKQATPHYHLARVYDRLGKTADAEAERKKHQELTSRDQ